MWRASPLRPERPPSRSSRGSWRRRKKKFPQLRGEVVGIVNDFFGHSITVSGLVTAQDLIAQLKDRPTLGERVLIPANMLRHGEGVFLDDYTVEQVEQALRTQADDLRDRRLFAL